MRCVPISLIAWRPWDPLLSSAVWLALPEPTRGEAHGGGSGVMTSQARPPTAEGVLLSPACSVRVSGLTYS